MKIRSGWAYLLAAVLTSTVACSSDNNNGGTSGTGGHAGTTGTGGHAGGGGHGGNATTGGGGNAGGSAGNVTTGGGGNGGAVTTGGGGNAGSGTTGGGGSAGNRGGAGAGGNAGHGGGGVGGGGGAAAALTDAQIAGIAYAANMGELGQAQLAGTKSTNSAVLNFATMMITDHGAAITRLQQTLAAQNIMTADSPQRQSLTNTSNQTYNTLFTQSGATFDKTYATAQVSEHQTYLNLLDQALIPDAQNAALKTELQMERTTVANHLMMAQMLVTALSTDGGVPHDAGGDAH
ncbi:MAG TPA: DUF4142 domain-containing protein [Polyangia bacterium]|nr:DUF4142 domain-containing protein [Polyangia bacterium]